MRSLGASSRLAAGFSVRRVWARISGRASREWLLLAALSSVAIVGLSGLAGGAMTPARCVAVAAYLRAATVLASTGLLAYAVLRVARRMHWSGAAEPTVAVGATATSEQASAGLAASLEQEQRARRQAEAVRRRLEFLTHAESVVSSSLDFASTVASVSRLAVPQLADWCVIDFVDERSGGLRPTEVVHRDPSRVQTLREWYAHRPREFDAVIRTALEAGSPRVWHAAELTDDALGAELERLGVRTYLVAPLSARGRVFGALHLATTEISGRDLGGDQVSMAAELAARASQAIDNARLYRDAHQAIREREDLLSVASHELKTPVTSLRLQAQTLLRSIRRAESSGLRPERVSMLEAIEQQTRRLTTLVDSLLDAAQIGGGKLNLVLAPLDLGEIARDVVARLVREAAETGTEVRLRVPKPVQGVWDRVRLEQVLTNLLSNAVKYGAGRPVEMEIDADEHEARIRVRDQGIGIAPEHLGRVFDRFERVAAPEGTRGLGLGLYIVRQIVEAMGGTVGVTSRVGEGSEFWVRFPRGTTPVAA